MHTPGALQDAPKGQQGQLIEHQLPVARDIPKVNRKYRSTCNNKEKHLNGRRRLVHEGESCYCGGTLPLTVSLSVPEGG